MSYTDKKALILQIISYITSLLLLIPFNSFHLVSRCNFSIENKLFFFFNIKIIDNQEDIIVGFALYQECTPMDFSSATQGPKSVVYTM